MVINNESIIVDWGRGMDGTPSRRDDNGDGKCIGAHLSNGDVSSLLVNCGVEDDTASHRLDENGIRERGEEIEVLCAERQLLPSTIKDPEKARKCESSPGGIGDGPGEPFSRFAKNIRPIYVLLPVGSTACVSVQSKRSVLL